MAGGRKQVTHHGTWAVCHQVQPHAPPPFRLSPPGERHPRWRCLCPWPGQELWAGRDEAERGKGGEKKEGKKQLSWTRRDTVYKPATNNNFYINNNCLTRLSIFRNELLPWHPHISGSACIIMPYDNNGVISLILEQTFHTKDREDVVETLSQIIISYCISKCEFWHPDFSKWLLSWESHLLDNPGIIM